jgi:N-acetylglucosamine-6-phosphate deacetylase
MSLGCTDAATGSSGPPDDVARAAAPVSVTHRVRITGARLPGKENEGEFVIDIVDGLIESVAPPASVTSPDPPEVIPAAGLRAAPGFIDLQINGAAGFDLTADPFSIWAVGEALPRYGVTGFLPTIVTAPREVTEAALAVIAAGPPAGYRGAHPLGLHVEGPFLAPSRRGAHDPRFLREPDPAFVEGWSAAGGVGIVTLAPELPGAVALIRELVGRGVVVAVGHTDATEAETRAAFDAGATAVTHLTNAMAKDLDRGVGGVALADPRVTVGLIADGLHIDPGIVAEAWRAAGPARLVLVSDAIAALGMPPGRYPLGSTETTVDATSARLDDGRLAGSLLRLDQAVRNLRAFTGASIEEALATVTSTPARLLGLEGQRGALTRGAAGDVVLLTPDLSVAATIVGGRLAYQAGTIL